MLKRCLILLLGLSIAAPALAGGYGGGYHYGGYYNHRHHGGGNGDVLLAGLVIGGLLGYFISEDRHYRRPAYTTTTYSYYDGDPYYDDGYDRYSYRPRVYRERVRVAPPRRVVARERPPQASEFAGEDCRMTREYTTTIEIDGERHQAYGTRCLTANGSWVLGRPKLVPEFN